MKNNHAHVHTFTHAHAHTYPKRLEASRAAIRRPASKQKPTEGAYVTRSATTNPEVKLAKEYLREEIISKINHKLEDPPTGKKAFEAGMKGSTSHASDVASAAALSIVSKEIQFVCLSTRYVN